MTVPRGGSDAGSGTRERILEVGMELFLGRGYHETSMQQIADRLGITKAALYYHFPSKAHIAGSLLEPLADEMERVLDRAERVEDRREARAAVLEGYLDAMLRYRRSLLLLVRDVSAGPQEFYERTIRLTARAIDLVAGPGADLDEKVRATQALSALGDPLIMFPDTPDGELRGRMLEGAWRLLEGAAERRRER